jgi:GT2 family glycosyltransferase
LYLEIFCTFALPVLKIQIEKEMTIGVIISTYNHPAWLEKALWGYCCQTVKPDEIVIADDGSKNETRLLIESFTSLLPIKHAWHEDKDFRKTQILNKAIDMATAEYLIFTDQDCIPREDFVETHFRFSEKGYLLSGGYFKLPMDISIKINKDDIFSKKAFSLKWLRAQGLKASFKCLKLFHSRTFAMFMNFITPTKATWNGCNSSGWKEDMLKINGFNEQMQYGGEDREFGERLFNSGIRSKQIRYSAICLHLDHKRPYKTAESLAKNRAIRDNTRKNKIIETPLGIKKNHPHCSFQGKTGV